MIGIGKVVIKMLIVFKYREVQSVIIAYLMYETHLRWLGAVGSR